jgi:hypothetical protein
MEFNNVKKMSEKYLADQFLPGAPHIILEGTLPIMFSAPHAVGQVRMGRAKKSETYTGVIAQLLHQEYNYNAIIKKRNLYDDANFDEKSSYRENLITYINEKEIKLLVDLHIMNASYSNTIEMATGNGENIQGNWSLIDDITKLAHQRGIKKIVTDVNFFGLNPHCIAADIAKNCKIPAIQLEMNWRDLRDEASFQIIYSFFKDMKSIM